MENIQALHLPYIKLLNKNQKHFFQMIGKRYMAVFETTFNFMKEFKSSIRISISIKENNYKLSMFFKSVGKSDFVTYYTGYFPDEEKAYLELNNMLPSLMNMLYVTKNF